MQKHCPERGLKSLGSASAMGGGGVLDLSGCLGRRFLSSGICIITGVKGLPAEYCTEVKLSKINN